MKRMLQCIFLVFILCSFSFSSVSAAERLSKKYYDIINNYQYISSKDEWKYASSSKQSEMLALNYEMFQSLSSVELVRVILNYPGMIDALLMGSKYEGLSYLKSIYPAIEILQARSDKTSALSMVSNIVSNTDEVVILSAQSDYDSDIIAAEYLKILTFGNEIKKIHPASEHFHLHRGYHWWL